MRNLAHEENDFQHEHLKANRRRISHVIMRRLSRLSRALMMRITSCCSDIRMCTTWDKMINLPLIPPKIPPTNVHSRTCISPNRSNPRRESTRRMDRPRKLAANSGKPCRIRQSSHYRPAGRNSQDNRTRWNRTGRWDRSRRSDPRGKVLNLDYRIAEAERIFQDSHRGCRSLALPGC